MTKQHNRIEFKMQIPGHARCLINGGFALLNKLYRQCDCDSIGQLEDVVNRSSTTNTAVRYQAWQWRSWKEYLGQIFQPVKGIRQYQHFSFDSCEPGIITKKTCDEIEKVRDFSSEKKEDRMYFQVVDCLNLGCVISTRMWDLLSRRRRALLQFSNKLTELKFYFDTFWCKHFFRRWWTFIV